ncbi:MAG: response regulator transcription factor [Clostridia bacterium]
MPKILIVDDEKKIRDVLREYIQFAGFESDEAEDGMEAIDKCKKAEFDLIIMDIMMPRLDGLSAVKEIKKFCAAPVLFLSARNEEYDKLFGFEVGADDYVVKPFSPSEVIARIKAILSRINQSNKRDKMVFGDLVVDFDGRMVSIGDKKLEFTPKEYELLFYLVRKHSIAVSREELLANIWGSDFNGDDRTVDTHIKMLRSNLGSYRDTISTVRGMGYKFDY